MAELRSVDPRSLKPNPINPRTVPVPKEMDEQLLASILAIGLLQPPVVRDVNGELVVTAGHRRCKAAIAADLPLIDVYVLNSNEANDSMASISENLVRVGMNPVDTWRGITRLEQQGWNEEAIAAALAIPGRAVRKLKLMGSLHPPMLDFMAKGSMPTDEQMRTIANAPLADQAQVWKAHKPKKGHDVSWWEVARALSKPRIPFSAAKFDDELARAYGVVWQEDLFAPAGEDSRYTTNADGFFGAQQEWVNNHLPANGIILTLDEYGRPNLPKGAERIYGKPAKGDKVGYYIDSRSAEVETIAYRMPEPKKPAKTPAKTGSVPTDAPQDEDEVVVKLRPDVTQKGLAMIGDYRTDALQQALDDNTIPAETLVGLLVLALAANNVSVQSALPDSRYTRLDIRDRVTEGGVLTNDADLLHSAARDMLKLVLNCRVVTTDSGVSSRIAGHTLGADTHLPTMATEDFLSCLSRQAMERSATAAGVPAQARVKDTRAALVKHYSGATWHYPGALFALTDAETAAAASRPSWMTRGAAGEEGEPADDAADSEGQPDTAFDHDDDEASQPYPVAAE